MDILLDLLRLLASILIAFLAGKLISRLKLPSILGWLIAGMILGPHGLSLVSQEPHGIKASCMSRSVPWA